MSENIERGETEETGARSSGASTPTDFNILAKDSFRETARHVYETAEKLIGPRSGLTVIVNPAGGSPGISVWDADRREYSTPSSLSADITRILEKARTSTEPFYNTTLPYAPDKESRWNKAAGDHNSMIIPLNARGCSLGFIALNDKPGGFTEEDARKAGILSRLAAITVTRNMSLEMLSLREKQYRDLFEYAGEPIVITDMNGRLLDVNKKTCELLRYSKGELLEKNVREFTHPDRSQNARDRLKKIQTKGELVFESAYLRKDGHRIDMELTCRLFCHYGRKAILTIGKDISERKRAEEFSRHDKDRLRSLWDIYSSQAKGVKDLLDYVLDEAIKLTKSRAGSIYLYHYDDKKNKFTLETWVKDTQNGGEIIIKPTVLDPQKTGIWGEALIKRKPVLTEGAGAEAGTPDFMEQGGKCARCMAIPVFISERSAAVIGLAHKASPYTDSDAKQLSLLMDSAWEMVRRKKSEDELAKNISTLNAIVNSTPDAVTAKDMSGRYTVLNLRACALMRRKMEEVIGQTDLAIFPAEKAERIRTNDKKIISSGKVQTSEEEIYSNGKKIPFLVTKGPLFDGIGHIMGVFSIDRDITDRKKMEMEALNSQKAESLSLLACGIAHDFNNMLTAVLGNTALALESVPADNRLFRLLSNTLKAARSAQELTHQLRSFANPEKTDIRQTFYLQQPVRDAAMLAASGSKTRITFSFADDIPPVKGNEGQLKQVINNLALNAIQSMPEGGLITVKAAPVHITEDILPDLKPGPHVRITVSDTGPGIPERSAHRIFDPYFSTKKKGRGLGLSMVRSIVTNHGGHIGVVSKKGEGTTFVIYLPAGGARNVRKEKPRERLRTGSGRILVMDDDTLVLDVLTLILKRLGYDTSTAEDGKAAIISYTRAAAENRPFSAVIMDLTIPGGMGGDEAAKRLRMLDPGVKIIVSSGYAASAPAALRAEHHFDAVLPKPYRMEEVGEILERMLKTQQTSGRVKE